MAGHNGGNREAEPRPGHGRLTAPVRPAVRHHRPHQWRTCMTIVKAHVRCRRLALAFAWLVRPSIFDQFGYEMTFFGQSDNCAPAVNRLYRSRNVPAAPVYRLIGKPIHFTYLTFRISNLVRDDFFTFCPLIFLADTLGNSEDFLRSGNTFRHLGQAIVHHTDVIRWGRFYNLFGRRP